MNYQHLVHAPSTPALTNLSPFPAAANSSLATEEGDYDVEIPSDAPSGMYSVRVGVFEDDSVYGCSGEFEIVGEEDDDMSMSYRF